MYRARKLYVAKGLVVSRKCSHLRRGYQAYGKLGVGLGEWQDPARLSGAWLCELAGGLQW